LDTDLKQIKITPLKDFDFKKSKLVGEHNKLNFFCANEVCKNICSNYSADVFQHFIDSFKAPKYRLEFKGESAGKEFYNDSKSTNIESTLKAVEAFPLAQELTLIIGGKLRQDSVDEFKVLKEKGVGQIIVFGESASNISKVLDVTKVETLDDIFKCIRKDSKNIILFSPGFPSFDQFKNFEERGEKFNKLFTKFCDETIK
jgi:UDP-N-acetylmuramoylalanine--D-glutamate ligase